MKTAYESTTKAMMRAQDDLEKFCVKNSVGEDVAYAMELCLDELFSNAIHYGYADDATKKIDVTMKISDGKMILTIADDAPKFNPFEDAPKPNIDAKLEERSVGGLGIFFVTKMVDSAIYERKENCNVVTLSKKIGNDLKNA